MTKWIAYIALVVILTACREQAPGVQWELTIDGDVDRPVTYTYQELLRLHRTKLTDVPLRDSGTPDQFTAWEGIQLFLLFQKPGGVPFTIDRWATVTLADGTSRRFNLSELHGGLIAVKDGDGNWLANTAEAPIRLIAPNRPSGEWLQGPVQITIQGP